MAFSGEISFSSSTDIPLQRSVSMSASATVIPRMPVGSMGRIFYSSSLSLNLFTPSSYGTTAEAIEYSRECISKSKRYYFGPYSVICTILLVSLSSLFGKYSWRMMNESVTVLPLLTTKLFCPTSTSHSTLFLRHVVGHSFLMRV